MSIIGDTLDDLAAAAPHRAALICDDRVMDRHGFAATVRALACELGARCPEGAAIALDLPNGPELLALFFACAVSGRQALVYDPAWPAPYRRAIDAALAPHLTLLGNEEWLQARDVGCLPPAPSPDAPFYVGFTSGSTGLPKGYRRAHRSWIESFEVSRLAFGLREDDVILSPGGLAASLHLYGAVHALHIGASAVIMRRFHPRRALSAIARHHITAVYVTPTQLALMLEASGGQVLPNLRVLMVSGAKWQAESRAATERLFPNAEIIEFYGASELSFVTVNRASDGAPAGSVGRAAPGVGLRIRDGDGRDLERGEVGAIWVQSAMQFSGYACGGGDETRREDGWMTIGDHGALDADGCLTLYGREKRMLVTSGLNVYPEEVERVLMQVHGVAEAAVFGLADPLRGTELVAVLRGEGTDEAALRLHCRAHLPLAKIPRRFVYLADWPRTSGGKADLPALCRRAEEFLEP